MERINNTFVGKELIMKELKDEINEEKFRLLYENLPLGYQSLDLQGNLIIVNQAWLDLLGYSSKEEVLGKSFGDFITERALFAERFPKFKQCGITHKVLFEMIRKDGSLILISIDGRVSYNKNGDFIQTHCMLHDFTEKHEAEEERKRLHKVLERKNKELEEVIYVTSHDLRTPLVNIEGFSKELGRSVNELFTAFQKGSFPEDIKEKVASIVNNDVPESQKYISTSITKMESLLSGLLKLSRLGLTELKIERLNMNEMISDVLSILKAHMNYSDIEVKISELPSCIGDERQINHVFSNLIGNAIKYLDSNRQGIIKVSGYKDNSQSLYCVEDNGIGIAPEYQKKIFEIFHRLEPAKSIGEGLGLNIVHRAIERHNGKIWVESEPGRGSKFFVSLQNTNT